MQKVKAHKTPEIFLTRKLPCRKTSGPRPDWTPPSTNWLQTLAYYKTSVWDVAETNSSPPSELATVAFLTSLDPPQIVTHLIPLADVRYRPRSCFDRCQRLLSAILGFKPKLLTYGVTVLYQFTINKDDFLRIVKSRSYGNLLHKSGLTRKPTSQCPICIYLSYRWRTT